MTQTAVWILGAVSAFLLFASVFLHELMHSLVAKANRMRVDKITLFFFGGVAQIPGENLTPKKEFKMAISGPLFSLALGLMFFLIYKYSPDLYLEAICSYLWRVNIILAVFNMVPGFPLDGGRVFRSILWYVYRDIKKATRIAAYGGKIFAVFLIVTGFAGMIFGGYGGFWFVVLGFFLYFIAGASYEQIILKELLSKVHVKELMLKKPIGVKDDITVADLFSKFLEMRHESFLVIRAKEIVGIVSLQSIKNIPKADWQRIKVSEIMTKDIKAISPDDNMFNALMKMTEYNVDILPVRKDGKIEGILSREDILHYVRIKNTV
jgi:Zn-dependent protease